MTHRINIKNHNMYNDFDVATQGIVTLFGNTEAIIMREGEERFGADNL